MEKILSRAEVIEYLGISRPTLRKIVKAGDFPRPFKISKSSSWLERDVTRWLLDIAREASEGVQDET